MTLRRLEVKEMQMIFEWDDADNGFALAVACGDRDVAYGIVRGIGETASRLGVVWEDMELTERYRPVCGMRIMALVWRGEVVSEGGVQELADVILRGLGVVQGLE